MERVKDEKLSVGKEPKEKDYKASSTVRGAARLEAGNWWTSARSPVIDMVLKKTQKIILGCQRCCISVVTIMQRGQK